MNPSSREEAKRVWCRFAGPGRGDCEHYVGIPKEEKYPETVDEYGIPHGWCEYCWSVEKRNRLTALLEKKDEEISSAQTYIEWAKKYMDKLEAQNKALREMVEYMSQLKHYGHDIEAGCTVVCSWADKAKALLKAGGR